MPDFETATSNLLPLKIHAQINVHYPTTENRLGVEASILQVVRGPLNLLTCLSSASLTIPIFESNEPVCADGFSPTWTYSGTCMLSNLNMAMTESRFTSKMVEFLKEIY